MIDDLVALRLQLDWGADETLGEWPVDRFAPPPAPAQPARAAVRAAPAVLAGTLDELHAELDAFTGCPLRATATHTVRPSGNPAAPLLLIADAPGSEDDRAGQAFSGPPGAVLDRVMGSIGLDRTQMLLTTLVPWRPPGNRPASESEIQACLPFLHRLLGIVRPQRVILLGAGPVQTLTGQNGTIRQLRGRWLDLSIASQQLNVPALPMLPLSQWLRDGASKQQCWSDLMLLYDVLRTPSN